MLKTERARAVPNVSDQRSAKSHMLTQSFTATQSHPFAMSMATFTLQGQSGVAATETALPPKPKTRTV